MPIDIEALKAKLTKMQNKGQQGQRKFKTVLWTPNRGSYLVRIIPWSDDFMVLLDTPPFAERWFYYALGNRMVAPALGQPDPVRELRDALFSDRSTENLASAKKLKPKMRCYVPVIVAALADEPDEGVKKGDKVVRLWSLNETVYKDILSYMVDPEYGDLSDPDVGRDITVDITDSGKKIPDDKEGKTFNDIKIRPKTSTRSLDAAERELLTRVPSIDEVAPISSYDKLKDALERFIDGGPTGGQVERGRQRGGSNSGGSSGTASGHTTPTKGSLDDAFDELLNK